MDAQWWRLPGPGGFVADAIDGMLSDGVAVVMAPENAIEDFVAAALQRLSGDYALAAATVDAGAVSRDRSVIHGLAAAHGASGAAIGSVAEFLEAPALADAAIIVTGLTDAACSALGYVLRAIREERRSSPAVAGPFLLLVAPLGLGEDARARLTGGQPVKLWRGVVTPLDCGAWLASHAVRRGPSLLSRLASATTIEIAGWSRDALEEISTWEDDEQLHPYDKLRAWANGGTWSNPSFENGLLDLWDDLPAAHPGAAIALGDHLEIRRRVWSAQAKTLLPALDAARRRFIDVHMSLLAGDACIAKPFPKKIGDNTLQITDPRELEWRDIGVLLKDKLPGDDVAMVNTFAWARNGLAHGRPLPLEKLKVISLWWERARGIIAPSSGTNARRN